MYIPADLFVMALIDRISPLEKDSPPRTFGDIWNKLHDLYSKNQGVIDQLLQEAKDLRAAKNVKLAKAKESDAQRAQANVDTFKALLVLTGEAPNDLAALQKNRERWYDEGMERISGWISVHTPEPRKTSGFRTHRQQ